MAHRNNTNHAADDKKVTEVIPQQFGDPRTVEITESTPNHKCCFCHRHELNPTEWGAMLQLDDITTHYFCLLFSAKTKQDGSDDEGIHGFLPRDIGIEVRRGNRLKCRFCKKITATIGCEFGKCSASFHYTCGYENGCLNMFFDPYQSFCFKHKPKQAIPKDTSRECPICMVETEKDDAIWPPCCGKQLFHRRCIMFTAKTAGSYFFKCPLCNSTEPTFIQAMKANGVYIPDRDALWELEPNAFEELKAHYSRCDAEFCLCPGGREFTAETGAKNWHLIRCGGCGASATHMKCSGLKIYKWKCMDCKTILQNSEVKDQADDAGISSSPDDSDAESTPSDSSDETSSEEEILPNLPDISNVINFHKVPAGAILSLPLPISQVGKTASDERTMETVHEAHTSRPELSNDNSAVDTKPPQGVTEEFQVRNDNHTSSAGFQLKLKQLRHALTTLRVTDKEQSTVGKEAEGRVASLQAFLHSKSLERKEERWRARREENGDWDQEVDTTKQVITGTEQYPTETEDSNSPVSSGSENGFGDGMVQSDGVVPRTNNGNELPEGNLKQLGIRKFFNSIPHHELSLEEDTREDQDVEDIDRNQSVPHGVVKRVTAEDAKDHYRKVSVLQEYLYKLANNGNQAGGRSAEGDADIHALHHPAGIKK